MFKIFIAVVIGIYFLLESKYGNASINYELYTET